DRMDRAELVFGFLQCAVDAVGDRDVKHDALRLAARCADLVNRRIQRFGPARGKRHTGAVCSEKASKMPPETAGGAGDQNMFVIDFEHGRLQQEGSVDAETVRTLATCARPRPRQQAAAGLAPRQDRSCRRTKWLPASPPCRAAPDGWRWSGRSRA